MPSASDLAEQLAEIRSALSSLARRPERARTTVVYRRTIATGTEEPPSPPLAAETPIFTLLEGDEDDLKLADETDSGSGTWNDVDLSSLLPESANLAYVRFLADGRSSTAEIKIHVRPTAGGDIRTPMNLLSNSDSSDVNTEFVRLADRAFQYRPTYGSGGNWSLVLLGYL